jgi:hypothetical protein
MAKAHVKRNSRLRFETLEPRLVLDAAPMITEFLADNKAGLADTNGNRWDWIEMYNAGDVSIDLGPSGTTDAWSLKCGGDSWDFPSGYTLAAREFRVIYAAGNSPSPTPAGTWADFKLAKNGENLKLVNPVGQTISDFSPYPNQETDISYGLGQTGSGSDITTTDTAYYFSTPTPGAMNSKSYWNKVKDTKFSYDHGFYSSPLVLSVTSETDDAAIRFTLNGTEPSENGRVKTVAMITRGEDSRHDHPQRHHGHRLLPGPRVRRGQYGIGQRGRPVGVQRPGDDHRRGPRYVQLHGVGLAHHAGHGRVHRRAQHGENRQRHYP